MSDLIEIEGLSKSYKALGRDRVTALNDFSLKVSSDHHLISLTGPDGAGKSTLLKLLAGVLKKDDGKVILKDTLPDNSDPAFTQDIGYMSQTLGLYGELSVLDNLRIFAGLKGVDLKKNEDYLLTLLDKVQLLKFKDRAADALSGGMKQKLGLICAFASQPKILILDEPTVGVDPVSRAELWQVIYEYLEKSHAYCIFSTAYLEEAAKADLVLMMNDGRILLQGRPQDLSEKISGRTYSLEIGNGCYQTIVRQLMSISARNLAVSPIIDVVPRLGRIDILGKEIDNASEIEAFIKERIAIDFKLLKREPILEDAYIAQCFTTQDISLHEAESQAMLKVNRFDPNSAVVEVHEIKKQFGSFTAVQKSSFKVHKGEIFGLLGPNGAGKTTTFRMICALLAPTSGSVKVNGFDLNHAKDDARGTIGYVSQKFSLYRKLSVMQNLEYFGLSYGLYGKVLKKRIEELLEEFSLDKFKLVKGEDLPFGMQRQLSMACALIHRPKILFLDEATSGADPYARRNFWDRVSALASSGTCVIVTTHFMDEAEYCDNFLIQDQGKILVLGSPDEICVKDGKRISIEDTFVEQVLKFRQEGDRK